MPLLSEQSHAKVKGMLTCQLVIQYILNKYACAIFNVHTYQIP